MTKTIDTLLEDLEGLFVDGHTFSEENLDHFCKNMKELLIDRFTKKVRVPYLRMSLLGTGNRKLWYLMHKPLQREKVADMKFLYGDIVEELLLLLVKESGHKVTEEQAEVTVNGVKGHIDCFIDDYLIDVKSASDFAFKKFSHGTLAENDSFGYIAQLSGYAHAYKTTKAGFLALNKVTGERTIFKVRATDFMDAPQRVDEVKAIVALPNPPEEKCYEPVPHGKSGNYKLHTNCGYCPYKEQCWSSNNGGKGLRKFKYSSGVLYFTEVLNEPRVEEIFPTEDKD